MPKHLFLLHGAIATKGQLAKIEKELSAFYQVHLLNFAGHGGATISTNFSIDLFSQNVLDYLQGNQIEQTHIFGYSMGGYVALQIAKTHPELVEKIVTLGTKFAWTEEVAQKEVKMLNPVKIQEKVPKFAAHLERIHGKQWQQVLQETANMMLDLGRDKPLKDADFMAINHPVLVAIGDADHMVSMEETEHVARLLPNGRNKIIKACPHPIEKVNQVELANIIRDFLDI